MSFNAIVPYFASRAKLAGLTWEHPDQNDIENVPATRLPSAYHVDIPSISGNSQNQTTVDATASVNLTFWQLSREKALEKFDDILCLLVDDANRVSQAGFIKNVSLESVALEKMSLSNDTITKVQCTFNVRLIMGVE